jgi:Asp-tRNA(Asn)/Glu-tRNA(Gln) amidotransferase A subunit family amidase
MRQTLQQLREWENQGFRIFTEVIEEDVLRQAFESDKRYQNGSPLSILDGIPIAVKDTLAVKRHHVYNGLNPHEDYSSFWTFSSDDDILVKRFREAGAIILGLTIMTEGGGKLMSLLGLYILAISHFSFFKICISDPIGLQYAF